MENIVKLVAVAVILTQGVLGHISNKPVCPSGSPLRNFTASDGAIHNIECYDPDLHSIIWSTDGIFDNRAMTPAIQSNMNGADSARILHGGFKVSSPTAADGFSSAIKVPPGTKSVNADAYAAYVEADNDATGTKTGYGVGFYSVVRANANGAAVWGTNEVATDFPLAGLRSLKLTGDEIDFGCSQGNSCSYVHGLDLFYSPFGTGGELPGDNAYIQLAASQNCAHGCPNRGIYIAGLSVGKGPAILIGTDAAAGGTSQPIKTCGTNNSGALGCSVSKTDSNGNAVVSNNGGNYHFTLYGETGSCSMSNSRSCSFTISSGFNTPLCSASIKSGLGENAFAAMCSLSGRTVTIMANGNNSLTWQAVVIGAPN